MRKFKVGDFVTVVENDVWYTYLDSIRKELVGKTGRVISIGEIDFTKEDAEWNYIKKLSDGYTKNDWKEVPDYWTQTVYDCKVRFTDGREIVFSEVHLKAFEMPERN